MKLLEWQEGAITDDALLNFFTDSLYEMDKHAGCLLYLLFKKNITGSEIKSCEGTKLIGQAYLDLHGASHLTNRLLRNPLIINRENQELFMEIMQRGQQGLDDFKQ